MNQPGDGSNRDYISAAEDWVQPPRDSSFGRFKRVIQLGLLVISIVAAVPTIITLYHAVSNEVPYTRVNHLLAQQKMWQTQGACMPSIKFDELTTGQGTKVFVGACPASGDILFRLVNADGKINHEWFPLANFNRTSGEGIGILDWLVSRARAAGRAGNGQIQLAQSSSFSVVCQANGPKNTLVRVVKESGVCFKETMSLFTGAVTKRDQVDCNTSCTATTGNG